ncbi:hypothetical protein CRT60_16460 [Azospirillum palustre]|uniref:Uncharacterized protein n=1 Tax=Azospirillum palustre TaxID=2044885 RepID=A0A2B8B5F2_9PROT|nr:hypothetical protein [Azospirillum palustre]PGH56514.1 hypothetical protein CRT60_16460 [Azospirillum palustre]
MTTPINAPAGANAYALPGCINHLPKRGTGPGSDPDAELLFAWDTYVNAVTAYQCAPDGEERLYEEIAFNIGLRLEELRPKSMRGLVRQLRYLLTKHIDIDDAWDVIIFEEDMTPNLQMVLNEDPHANMLWNMIDSIDGPAERIARMAARPTSAPGASSIIPSLDQTFTAASAMVLSLFDEHAAATMAGPDNLPDHLVVEACDIRRAVFTTPPKTPADAMAVLELLAHDVAGMGHGDHVEAQETAVALLRDFMKPLAGQ